MLDKLSSYQNPEGQMKDGLIPRTDKRLSMINPEIFKDKTVLDLGCNNGYFVRFALEHGAKRAVGVDKSGCIVGARELAKGTQAEFWQVDMESKEFMRFCPQFQVVLLMSALAKIKDKEKWLDWLDGIVRERLIFESNHGEVHKQDIDLVRKHIWFKYVDFLGASEIPERPHYLWDCQKINIETRYGFLAGLQVEWIPIDKIERFDEYLLKQKTKYTFDSEEFLKLKEDIKQRGLRRPIIVMERNGKIWGFQGGHRYFACKQLGYKEIPCKVIRGHFIKHLKENG